MIHHIIVAMTATFAFTFSANNYSIFDTLAVNYNQLKTKRIGMKCYRCNSQLIQRSCKLECANCGYSLDCSDM
jgi:hypothetical protein